MPRPLLSCVLSISVAALAHASLEESCPPSLESRSGILLQHKVAEIQSEELTEEPAPLKMWAELREDEGQGLDAKDSEALTLHDMLKPAGGKPQEAHMVPPTTVQNGHFELCHPQTGNALGQVSEGLNVSSSWNEVGGSCSNSEVVLFYPGETSAGFPGFSTSCCPADKEFCAGCSKLNSDKTGCEVCSGGFTLRSDKTCMACVDLPGWANKALESCITASCTSEKYQGISAQDACCKCGGGQKEGTQFAYYVAPLAIGSTEVIGYPMPRTGSRYSVDKDCELMKYGLTINSHTGALQLSPSCSVVGCGAAAPIEVKCTIFAEKALGFMQGTLWSKAPLEVFAGDVSYGSAPVVFSSAYPAPSIAPAVNPALAGAGEFGGLSCVPDVTSWLSLDSATGKLSMDLGVWGNEGGVKDSKGNNMGAGAVCSVEKGGAKGSVVVLFPLFSVQYPYYSYHRGDVVYATVGEKSPVLPDLSVTQGHAFVEPSVLPTRYSVNCSGTGFAFDVLTGLATWEGHRIFQLDIVNGDFQLNPEESLTRSLDHTGDSATRRSIGPLACTIFKHFEYPPLGRGIALHHQLQIELRDHTCWAKKVRSFASRTDKGTRPFRKPDDPGSLDDDLCRSICRTEASCTHWAVEDGKCYSYSGVCTSAVVDDSACAYKHVTVTERYPGCGERHSCLDIQLPGYHYVSGKYCPSGENADKDPPKAYVGPVYFKTGFTSEESFWLERLHEHTCMWAIMKPKPSQDYENGTSAYVELHGDKVACITNSLDLVTDIFGSVQKDLSVTGLTEAVAGHINQVYVQGATGKVAAPGCVAPNVTAEDGEEESEQSVVPLVLDDPASDQPDDHWLHPCECVPPDWGPLPPVNGQVLSDIPAGSYNEFIPGPTLIVGGQFACEQEHLTNVFMEDPESDGFAEGYCQTQCATNFCKFYWEGEVLSSTQCRLYSQCKELVREVGIVGKLYGMTYSKACKIADPTLCWKVTKRRSFLGAGDDTYPCRFQDLVQQCDHKLMLGGLGVENCGQCEYALVQGKPLVANGQCLTADQAGNVHLADCNGEANQVWSVDGQALVPGHVDKCLGFTNWYAAILETCDQGTDQQWYISVSTMNGKNLKSRKEGRCLDIKSGENNLWASGCPPYNTLRWEWGRTESAARNKKTPLPSSFEHGQSLRASCWAERFASGSGGAARGSETMSCVAGAWVNSHNKPGLEGFACLACIQVVSKTYAELDSKIKQELFFASRMKVQLSVDTRTRRTVTSFGNFQTGSSVDVFTADLLPGAADTMRRYRSLTHQGQCLRAGSHRLGGGPCSDEAESDQLLEAVELSSLLWDEFKTSADVPGKQQAGLSTRGTAPTTLRSFQLDASCGEHALASIELNHNSRLLGMSATCTAAATYSNPVEHVISVPGAVTITSVSEGTCMSIHRIIPWNLKVRDARQDRRCMDARTDNKNVYTQRCHDGRNQLWYMLDGNIMSLFDRKCLDYHTDTRNVYMHECHGGANQKWYFEEGTARIRSEVDHKCLDLNIGDAFNIYMYDCHDEKNQQFDREERSNSAFTIALHLDCSESEFEEITVEPVDWQKFQLRNSPNTLPGDFRWKNDVKKIQNVHTGKCLEAKTLGRVQEADCSERMEQEWTMSHGLQGLVDAPIMCPGDQVISSMRKTSSEIRYHCSHVSSLGMCTEHYSTQVETISPELETIKALRMLGATCPPSEGLKSLEFEASDKGKWIRFKYVCCQISRIPVSIYPPLGNGDKRSFEEDMAQGWEGVYCPVAPDDSGRMAFLQTRSFRPGHRLLFNLQMFVYDRHLGKWCVHGRSCVDSDVVHPLDTSLHNDEWSVIPVSDFDAVFEAKGAKPLAAKKKRKPPPLIKFGASDPDYLPECKDESHPGARKFKLEDMNNEAKNLDDENPCKYVSATPPQNGEMEGADGMAWWMEDLNGNAGPGQAGVTYRSVKECTDRERARNLHIFKLRQEHSVKAGVASLAADALRGYSAGVPDVVVAPMGAGILKKPGSLIADIGSYAFSLLKAYFDMEQSGHEKQYTTAIDRDCNPIQHGFARTFCDLHCIRDAVRKGDDAILRALEDAVEIVGKNTQILLEHYVGQNSGHTALNEEGAQIREAVKTSLAEMAAMASEAALEPGASVAAARAIRSFSSRWQGAAGANVSEGLRSLRELSGDVATLHTTVMAVSSRKMSRAEEVQQQSLQMASYMNEWLEGKTHLLGVYQHNAGQTKRVQRWFRDQLHSKMSLMSEVQDLRISQAMVSFDSIWWEIRKKLDAYLEAAEQHVQATEKASTALRGYTGRCQTSFAQLKDAYAASARAERKAHHVLKKTWSEVAFQAGLMASKVVDGALLDHLALADVKAAGAIHANQQEVDAFCASDEAGGLQHMRQHLLNVTEKGLLGQTRDQLTVLYGEIGMLQNRFRAAGLGEAPHAEVVKEASMRLEMAAAAAQSGANHLASDMAEHWRHQLCGGMMSRLLRMLW